ncbi:MAG: hypothetical protein QHI48_06140 [Bacteroidota bacterium]|nr:hypothetical protein [Bacteroidota bacterium]
MTKQTKEPDWDVLEILAASVGIGWKIGRFLATRNPAVLLPIILFSGGKFCTSIIKTILEVLDED